MKRLSIIVFLLFNSFGLFAQEDFDQIFRLNRTSFPAQIDSISANTISYFEMGAPEIKKEIRISAVWKILYKDGLEKLFNSPLPEAITEFSSEEESLGKVEPDSAKATSTSLEELDKNDKTPFIFYVDNRPVYAINVSFSPHVLVHDQAFVSALPDRGLGLRFGLGLDLGLEFNFHQLFGVSLTSGITRTATQLSFLPEDESLRDQRLILRTIPTTLRFKFYPMDGLNISIGPVFNSLSLSADEDFISNSRKVGYTVGFGRLTSIGRNKNLLEVSINYTHVGLNEPTSLLLGSSGPYELDKLGYVNLKFAFQIGVFNK